MARDIGVKGAAELDKFLSVLPANMQKAAYRQALTAAAAPIRDRARELAPKETGAMAKAIKSGSPRQNQDGTFSITIGMKGKDGYLGLFHEFGTDAHLIAKTGKGQGRVALRLAASGKGTVDMGVLKIGEEYVSGIISHPGSRPQPFLLPALDMEGDAAIAAFARRIREYLEGKTGFVAPMDEAA